MITEETYIDDPYFEIGRKLLLILKTGQILMESAADTSRIARTMKRVSAFMMIPQKALHIHITYTTIMISISDGNHSITKFQKCLRHSIDMKKISALSKLSWTAMEKNYSLDEYEANLKKIAESHKEYISTFVAIGAGFACGGFCKLFGCDWVAFFYTAFCAMIGFRIRFLCNNCNINPYASIAISSFAATTLAYLTHLLPGSLTPWHPLLACSLFIVPGIPLINAVDDLLDNYIVSGMTRAINTILMVGSMSFGIVLAIKICYVTDFTMINTRPNSSFLVYAVAAAIAAVGFSTIFNVPRRLLWVVALGGIISVCTRNFVNFNLDMGLPMGSFIGAMLVSCLSIKVVHYVHTPIHVITLPSVIPMIPGVLMYRLMFGFINISTMDIASFMQLFQSGVIASLTILAIAVGIAIPNIFARGYLGHSKKEHFKQLLQKRKGMCFKKSTV
ncbi:threonine/serine exporter family protein [Pectinatus sottacetonis]|uniref:threonine/serine ThrE exporter family protein n=1 Tax=Pectinatus sottacetonis TaxID=1002795 RepID=UPI0018C4B0C1|nr:threonine/serine exporter family protein [Pectinatus sottacetonis]